MIKAPEARPTPANVLARLAWVTQPAPSAGLARLQQATRAEVARRGETACAASASRSAVDRRDVYVWTDGNRRWIVEARSGGLDGRSRRQAVHSEREALALAQRWRELGGDNWKDITPSRTRLPGPGPGPDQSPERGSGHER
jgi:hypothetical protein